MAVNPASWNRQSVLTIDAKRHPADIISAHAASGKEARPPQPLSYLGAVGAILRYHGSTRVLPDQCQCKGGVRHLSHYCEPLYNPARSHPPKPPQCDIKATSMRVASQAVATPKPPPCVPHASLMRPSCVPHATSKPPRGECGQHPTSNIQHPVKDGQRLIYLGANAEGSRLQPRISRIGTDGPVRKQSGVGPFSCWATGRKHGKLIL